MRLWHAKICRKTSSSIEAVDENAFWFNNNLKERVVYLLFKHLVLYLFCEICTKSFRNWVNILFHGIKVLGRCTLYVQYALAKENGCSDNIHLTRKPCRIRKCAYVVPFTAKKRLFLRSHISSIELMLISFSRWKGPKSKS